MLFFCSLFLGKRTHQRRTQLVLTVVTITSCLDRCSARLTLKPHRRIRRKAKAFLTNPLSELSDRHIILLRNFLQRCCLMIPDILLYLLELLFQCVRTRRASHRSRNIVKQSFAGSACFYFHCLNLPRRLRQYRYKGHILF